MSRHLDPWSSYDAPLTSMRPRFTRPTLCPCPRTEKEATVDRTPAVRPLAPNCALLQCMRSLQTEPRPPSGRPVPCSRPHPRSTTSSPRWSSYACPVNLTADSGATACVLYTDRRLQTTTSGRFSYGSLNARRARQLGVAIGTKRNVFCCGRSLNVVAHSLM